MGSILIVSIWYTDNIQVLCTTSMSLVYKYTNSIQAVCTIKLKLIIYTWYTSSMQVGCTIMSIQLCTYVVYR